MKQKFLKEHGQSIVLIVLLMVGMVAMLGLIFDGGNAYLQRRRMQNAADAAALAGGRALALQRTAGSNDEDPIQIAINNFTQYNGGTTASANLLAFYINEERRPISRIGTVGFIPTAATGVSVTVATTFNTFFLTVLNVDTGRVDASAMVQTGRPTGMSNLFPLAVPTGTLTSGSPPPDGQCNFNLNRECQIWGENKGPGSRGWTTFKVCGGGANYLKDVLDGNASSGNVNIGDSICTETGSIDAMSDHLVPWINKDVVIPIYDCTNDVKSCPNYGTPNNGSNLKYHVAAFAVFKFTGFYFSNNNSAGDTSCYQITDKYLCGIFQRWATSATDINVDQTCTYGLCGFQMQQ